MNGFKEGATTVVTGDRKMTGDYNRHKKSCKSYCNGYCRLNKRDCTGSAHCDDYNDEKERFIIDRDWTFKGDLDQPLQTSLSEKYNELLKNLLKYISVDSAEGKVAQWIINSYKIKNMGIDKINVQIGENARKLFYKEENNSYLNGKIAFLNKEYDEALKLFADSIENGEVSQLFNMYLFLRENNNKEIEKGSGERLKIDENNILFLLLFASYAGNSKAKEQVKQFLMEKNRKLLSYFL